ncbi:BnaCnng68400D, partial [Brassica napus]
KDPAAALPVILTRLKQKQDEWTKCREDLNLVWADVYEKYHYKSLDHHSFSFKQQDSKFLSAKALVSEIKDLKKKSQKESNIPHLEYEYLDRSIHEDLFKLVQFSCEEMWSNKEKMGKVLRLWNSFLELMLGVPANEEIGNGAADKRSGDVDERVFYGNEDFYVLFRLHRILYERISLAKTYCTGGGEMNGPGEIQKILLVHHILMQGIPYKPNRFENHEFEDECRAIIGNQSYVLFILDKLLYRLVKQQLQAVVADNVDNKLLQLYESGKSRNTVYYENARILLHDENIYRMECVRTLIQSPHYVSPLRNSLLFIDPENLFQSSSPPRLSIQLMD